MAEIFGIQNADPYAAYQAPQDRTRKALASVLAGNAIKEEPVRGWGQALAKILSGVAGGYMADKADQDTQANLAGAPGEMASDQQKAASQWTDPGTVKGYQPPDPNNPDPAVDNANQNLDTSQVVGGGQKVGPDKSQNAISLMSQSANPFVQKSAADYQVKSLDTDLSTKAKLAEMLQEQNLKNEAPTETMKDAQAFGFLPKLDPNAPTGAPGAPITPPVGGGGPQNLGALADFKASMKGQGVKKTWAVPDQQDDTKDQTTLDAAQQSQNTLNEAKTLLAKIGPNSGLLGPGSDALIKAKQAVFEAGLISQDDYQKVADTATLRKVLSAGIVSQARMIPGRATNLGLGLLQQSNPSTANTAQDLNQIIDVVSKFQNEQADYINAKKSWRTQHQGMTDGFNQAYKANQDAKAAAAPQTPDNGSPAAPAGAGMQLNSPQAQPYIDRLKQKPNDPSFIQGFEKRFGPGSAAQALGQGGAAPNNLPIDGQAPVITPQPTPAGQQSLQKTELDSTVATGFRNDLKAKGYTDAQINAEMKKRGMLNG